MVGEPGRSSVRAAFGRFFSTFEGATNFNEIGDAPFGNYYGSPVPPQYVTPFVDRGTGNVEGQRFPTPPPPPSSSPSNPDTSINWANFLPIGTSPAFYYKNVLPYAEEYELSLQDSSVRRCWFRSVMWARKGITFSPRWRRIRVTPRFA